MVKNLAFPGSAGNNDGATKLDLAAGNYSDIAVLRSDNGNRLVEVPSTDLEGGKYYLFAATGLPETQVTVDVEVTDPAAVIAASSEIPEVTTPDVSFVRAAHFVTGADAVDLFVDGAASTVTGLASGSASDWVQLTPGDHALALVPTGKAIGDAIYGPETVTIPAGYFATVYATNSNKAAATVNVLVEDYSHIPTGKARATVIHAAEGAAPVNFMDGEDTILLQGLAFPGAIGDNDGSATIDLSAGSHDFSVTTGDGDSLVDMQGTAVTEGMYYLVVIEKGEGGITSLVVPTNIGELLGAGE